MNLIEQLQTTPKWDEFRTWFFKQKYEVGFEHANDESMFTELNFDLQKGVFEKFISENNTDITIDGYLGNETYGIGSTFADWKWFENFEQLLIWYFNN